MAAAPAIREPPSGQKLVASSTSKSSSSSGILPCTATSKEEAKAHNMNASAPADRCTWCHLYDKSWADASQGSCIGCCMQNPQSLWRCHKQLTDATDEDDSAEVCPPSDLHNISCMAVPAAVGAPVFGVTLTAAQHEHKSKHSPPVSTAQFNSELRMHS